MQPLRNRETLANEPAEDSFRCNCRLQTIHQQEIAERPNDNVDYEKLERLQAYGAENP